MNERTLKGLLGWLDSEPESAALMYERMRHRLIIFFAGRRCPHADELADVVLDRLAAKIDQGVTIEQHARNSYLLSIAAHVVLEHSRKAVAVPLTVELPTPAPADQFDLNRRLACLDKCMETISNRSRELIRKFYEGQGARKIEIRKSLAETLGIPVPALRSRAHRIRRRLEDCVARCLRTSLEVQ